MPNTKASAIVSLRDVVGSKGKDLEAAVLRELNPDDARIFETAGAAEWLPMETVSRIREKVAGVLYPEAPDRLFLIGKDVAHADFRGMYRIIIRAASPQTVMERSARIWKTFHDKGDAYVEDGKKTSGVFVVAGYPELLPPFRESVTGFVTGLLELTGAKNVRVNLVATDPQKWRWQASWE